MLRFIFCLALGLAIPVRSSCAENSLVQLLKDPGGVKEAKAIVQVIARYSDLSDLEAIKRDIIEAGLVESQGELYASVLATLSTCRERCHEVADAIIALESSPAEDLHRQVSVKASIPPTLLDRPSIPFWRAYVLLSSGNIKTKTLHPANSISQVFTLLKQDPAPKSILVVGAWVTRYPVDKHTMVSDFPVRTLVSYLSQAGDEKQSAERWLIIQEAYSKLNAILQADKERYAMYDTKQWMTQEIPSMIASLMALNNLAVWRGFMLDVAATSDEPLQKEIARVISGEFPLGMSEETIQMPAMKPNKMN